MQILISKEKNGDVYYDASNFALALQKMFYDRFDNDYYLDLDDPQEEDFNVSHFKQMLTYYQEIILGKSFDNLYTFLHMRRNYEYENFDIVNLK